MRAVPVRDGVEAIHDALRQRFGHDGFRPGQEEVVRAVLAGRDALVVLPTGSGKSLMYQLPAVLMEGLTLVISPLIALMKDQLDKLDTAGVDALTIHSALTAADRRAARAIFSAGSIRRSRRPPMWPGS